MDSYNHPKVIVIYQRCGCDYCNCPYNFILQSCIFKAQGNELNKNHVTSACSFMVKENIQYYLKNGSNVYGTVLDATKAFDRIDFCNLFREMIKREIPPLVIRLIINMYEKQSMAVRWNNEYSDSFRVSKGVNKVVYCLRYCSVYILTTC